MRKPSAKPTTSDLRVHGDSAEILINEVTVYVLEDMPPRPGKVGLMVALHSMEVGFDDFLLEIPEGQPGGSGNA